jgi:hypothetical protein
MPAKPETNRSSAFAFQNQRPLAIRAVPPRGSSGRCRSASSAQLRKNLYTKAGIKRIQLSTVAAQ